MTYRDRDRDHDIHVCILMHAYIQLHPGVCLNTARRPRDSIVLSDTGLSINEYLCSKDREMMEETVVCTLCVRMHVLHTCVYVCVCMYVCMVGWMDD